MVTAIITLIFLVFINACFAASEIALIGLNNNKVRQLAEAGDKKAGMLVGLLEQPSRFLSTIQIGITLAGFLASAFAADFFAGPFANALYEWGVPISLQLLSSISVIVITLVLAYFTLVFGELVPKQLALQRPEAVSNIVVVPLVALSKLFFPVVKLLTFSTNAILRLFRVDPNAKSEEATEEEIRMMVDIGGERGTIDNIEMKMINNIFEFNDKFASEIITHRTEMCALPIDATLEETILMVNKERYTRFPVYEGDMDRIVGILHVKDLFEFIGESTSFNLREIIRKPYFVHESKSLDALFADMQKDNVHIAIVLDEYGGTEGLVTIEDVIEEIVGEIFSESDGEGQDVEDREIIQLAPGKFSVDGIVHLYLLEDVLQVDLPDDEFDTLSGFLIGQLGYIPARAERPVINYKHITFEVTDIGDNRIEHVLVTIHGNPDEKE